MIGRNDDSVHLESIAEQVLSGGAIDGLVLTLIRGIPLMRSRFTRCLQHDRGACVGDIEGTRQAVEAITGDLCLKHANLVADPGLLSGSRVLEANSRVLPGQGYWRGTVGHSSFEHAAQVADTRRPRAIDSTRLVADEMRGSIACLRVVRRRIIHPRD